MVAALGEPSQVPWRDLQRWAGAMHRKLTGADIAALAAVGDLLRPGEAAEWQAACGHLPALEELARFAELGVETGADAWKWARALGGTTINPVTVEHLRTMGFRHGEDLYGWGQLLGIPPGRPPGPDELDRISSLRRVGVRRPRHAALWVERLGRVPTAADIQAAPLARLRVRARLVREIATAGGPLIPFEGPEFILLLLCVEMLVVGLAMFLLEAFTHQSQLRVILETAVATVVVMAFTQVPTPDPEYGYGRIPWKSPPGSDASVANTSG